MKGKNYQVTRKFIDLKYMSNLDYIYDCRVDHGRI